MTVQHMHPKAVAIIGAGPAGLTTARWLSSYGFQPVLFEAASQLGGQWNVAAPMSATWRGMRTNTSRIMTAFSDLAHADGTPVYPRQEEMLAYLEAYAELFGLGGRIRLNTRVERLEKAEGGYLITSRRDGEVSRERFARVVVATGRYTAPSLPQVRGRDGFTGALGVSHTAHYDGASVYRGMDVLVAGCSISALEIASDLALSGARSVTTSYRRQRYILPKLIAGVPTDHVMFTRAAALMGGVLPPEALAAGLQAKVTAAAGTPDQFGAMRPDENIFAAGITQAQYFLPLVAEGRIAVRPWRQRIEGRTFALRTALQRSSMPSYSARDTAFPCRSCQRTSRSASALMKPISTFATIPSTPTSTVSPSLASMTSSGRLSRCSNFRRVGLPMPGPERPRRFPERPLRTVWRKAVRGGTARRQ